MAMSMKSDPSSLEYPFKPNINFLMMKLLKEQNLFNCVNTIKPFRCWQCVNFETHNLTHLKHHFRADHAPLESDEELQQCEKCKFRTYSTYLALLHNTNCIGKIKIKTEGTENDVEEDGGFKCDQCPFETQYRNYLKEHVIWKHTDLDKVQWFECEHCPFRTRTKKSLRVHVLAKHTAREKIQLFKCGQCPYVGTMKRNFNRHMTRNHAKGKK